VPSLLLRQKGGGRSSQRLLLPITIIMILIPGDFIFWKSLSGIDSGRLERAACRTYPLYKCTQRFAFTIAVFLTLLDYRGTRILASSVLPRYPNASIQISPFGYVHKRTRTARPCLKGFIQFFLFLIPTVCRT
jgi:hypothetical protein